MANNNVIDFPKSAFNFLRKLSSNNNKEWFEQHREEFETHLFIPAQMFVTEFGERLRSIVPAINAIPKTDKSIFRLHRDVRFSKDKSPYKTNLGLLFWEGTRKKLECPAFYIHIDPKRFLIATGMYMFCDEHLKKFRETISNKRKAEELKQIISELEEKNYNTEGKTLKRVPRNYSADYEHADLYLFTGLYSEFLTEKIKPVLNEDFTDFCFNICNDQLPLQQWLKKNIA